jgi:hypothetical protein
MGVNSSDDRDGFCAKVKVQLQLMSRSSSRKDGSPRYAQQPARDVPEPTPMSLALQELTSLSEADLQARVVEPLLRQLGFRHVHVNSGPNERGKDLVAIKFDEFGNPLLYAIQLKKFRPSAKVGTDSSFGRLLDQLRQTLQEDVLDPLTNRSRPCDAALFITPFAVPLTVRDAFKARMSEPMFRMLRLLDGPLLLDLIRVTIYLTNQTI